MIKGDTDMKKIEYAMRTVKTSYIIGTMEDRQLPKVISNKLRLISIFHIIISIKYIYFI